MTLNRTSKFQTILGKFLTYFILLSCFAILGLYAVQRFGAQYAEQKIQEQLEHSGLTEFVHYQQVYFNPFTLTPSLEGVKVGAEDSPLLIFARISFNSYLVKHPNLDIDFWIQESPIDSLSRKTGTLMRSAGMNTLLGKGSFSSTIQDEGIVSELKLDIKDAGKLTLMSNIRLLDQHFTLSDLRSDILASFALGQPEALPIIYGEAIELRSLDIKYEESGLIHRLFSLSSSNQKNRINLEDALLLASQTVGFAPANSPEAKQIATSLQTFIETPKQLTLSLLPSTPTSVKELTLLANEGSLYKNSRITIQSHR